MRTVETTACIGRVCRCWRDGVNRIYGPDARRRPQLADAAPGMHGAQAFKRKHRRGTRFPMQQVWFITGSSRGFGRALVGAALDAGDRVVATARQPGQLAEFAERYGDRARPRALYVTDAGAVRDAVAAGADGFGRLDVVVNNAGYANVASAETGDEAAFRDQFATNLWGVYNVS